jgi:hypothetical protein
MICDFCGGTHATRMEIPYFIYDDVTDEQMEDPAIAMSAWGHPLTGNVCRKCLLGQLIKASNKQLVRRSLLEEISQALRDEKQWSEFGFVQWDRIVQSVEAIIKKADR